MQTLGFSHFIANADGVAWFIMMLMLFASMTTWYLILVKGLRMYRLRRRSAAFLKTFWAAPNIEAVAAHIRKSGADVRTFRCHACGNRK